MDLSWKMLLKDLISLIKDAIAAEAAEGKVLMEAKAKADAKVAELQASVEALAAMLENASEEVQAKNAEIAEVTEALGSIVSEIGAINPSPVLDTLAAEVVANEEVVTPEVLVEPVSEVGAPEVTPEVVVDPVLDSLEQAVEVAPVVEEVVE